MPLGGYCEACGRWVWVAPNGSGRCGHPRSRVRDVQQLRPLSSPRGTIMRTPSVSRITPSHARFWWRHSAWILLTLTLGFLNWLAFVYIGLRARQLQWLIWGFIYVLPLAATVAAVGSSFFWVALAFQIVVAVVSFIHAVAVRPRYQALMFGDPPPKSVPAPPMMVGEQRPELPRDLDDNVSQTLLEAYRRVGEMGEAANDIAKPEIRQGVAQLCVTARRILAEIQRHPERIDVARGFLTYYLDAAARIVGGYEQLAARGSFSAEVRKTLAQAENSLPGIQKAFDSQLESLLQLDLLDLECEIALLDKTLQMENLFKSRPGGGSPPVTLSQMPSGGTR
jgi:5-bromo-4-chloroindolyl phosphate hydrolysis protein